MTGRTSDWFAHCRREIAACVILSMALTMIGLVPALTVGVILDRVVQSRADATLLAILLAFVFFHLCELVFKYAFDRLMLFVTHSAVVAAETSFLERLGRMDYGSLERFADESGKARFLSIGPDIRFNAEWMVGITSIPFCVLVVAAGLASVSLSLALPILALTVVYGASHAVLSAKQKRMAGTLQTRRADELNCLDEVLNGLPTLKAHAGFPFMIRRWLQFKGRYEDVLVRSSRLAVVHNALGLLYERATLAIILGVGAYEAVNGTLSVGQLVMANMLFRQLASQVRQFAPLLHRRVGYLESRKMMVEFWNRLHLEATVASTTRVRQMKCVIAAKQVGYQTSAGTPLLDGIDIELPPGKTMAVIGESGAGKSTLLKLLSGHYSSTRGWVSVLGSAPSARTDLTFLSQHEALFSGSLAENILLGRQCQPDFLEHLVEELELDSALVEGCHRQPGRNVGSQLSGGERQRVVLARALIQRSAALFLDEPTTGLDARRRRAVLHLIASAAHKGVVVVFATHDQELLQQADFVLQLDRGTVVAFGPREQCVSCDSRVAVHDD